VSGVTTGLPGTVSAISSPVASPNPLAFDVDLAFKGPNPYRDVTRYGVRAVDPNVAPVTAGITANCTIASASVTISAASTFQNGDGVVIYGCGAPHSMTTPAAPTITPKLAAAGTGTGIVVDGPAGTTTYNYQIVVRNKAGGLTAASAVGSTTTGAAALGSQSVGISTLARANAVVTVTTSAPHGLAVGANVLINGTSDSTNFSGWYIVDTVADNTHFTFSSGMDTRNGAAAAATGGTVFWFNGNRLALPAVTGAWEYYVWRGTTYIGVSRPQGTSVTDLTFDDFGTTMMANMNRPDFVPATPPGAAASNHLVTTIVSGAGTTSLVLAAAAGTTVTAAGIRFDNAPNILTAANAASASGTLFFPAVTSGSYVVSSYLTMPFPLAISQAGPLYLNETVEYNQNTEWYGDLTPQPGSAAQFGWLPGATVTVNKANPGVYLNGSNSTGLFGLKFAYAGSNGALLLLLDMGTNVTWDTVSFSTGGSLDYMGVGLLQRAITGGTFSVILNRVSADGGPSVVQGASATPLIQFRKCGVFTANHMALARRGFFFEFAPAGADVTINSGRMQGGLTPALSFYNSGGSATANIWVQYEVDTMAHAIVANLSAADGDIGGGLWISGISAPSLDGATSPGKITGRPFQGMWSPAINIGAGGLLQGQNVRSAFFAAGTATDGVFATATGARYASQVFNSGVNVGNPYSLFINGAQPGKPAGTVAAGGSVPVGNHTYRVVPFWWNNADGVYSVDSDTITTTSGNQTVNLTWTAVAGNPKGYNIYRDGSLLIGTVPNVTTNSFSDTLGFVSGGSRSTLPAGGPSYINRDEVGALLVRTPQVVTGNLNNVRYVDGTKFAQTRAGIQAAIDDLPARGGLVVIPTVFALDATTLTVGSNGAGDPRTTGKSVLLYFANMGVWSGTANPMFTLADRSGVAGLNRSTYLQNTGASGARVLDIAHGAEHVIVRDISLLGKGPAIKAQGSIPGAKWSNLFLQSDSGSTIETQMLLDTFQAEGIFINHTSATGSCWRNGVTGTGGGAEWGMNNAAIRDLTCQMSTTGAGPALHWESDGGTQNTYGTGVIENIQILNARKEAIKVVGFGIGPLNIRNVKIGTPTLDAGTFDAITVTGSPSALTGVTLDGISGGTLTAYRYAINWASSGSGNRIKNVNAAGGTATLNVSGRFILEDIAGVFEGLKVERYRSGGTALVAGDISLVAGPSWGTTATVDTIEGNDQAVTFRVNSTGTGQAANPQIVITDKDGSWTLGPIVVVLRSGGSQLSVENTWTRTATALTITFNGTPVAAETFTYVVMKMGR